MDILVKIRSVMRAHDTQASAARALGISPQYLCDILHGRRAPGPAVLRALGLRRVVRIGRA